MGNGERVTAGQATKFADSLEDALPGISKVELQNGGLQDASRMLSGRSRPRAVELIRFLRGGEFVIATDVDAFTAVSADDIDLLIEALPVRCGPGESDQNPGEE